MRKLLLAGVTLVAFGLVGAAKAADLPADPVYKGAPLIVPAYDWTGFYVGVNAGYSWGNSSNTYTITGFPPFTGSTHMGGDVIGGQAGFNWQVNRIWVVGIEADLQGTNQKGTDTPAPIPTTSCVASIFGPVCTTTVNGVSMDQTLNWFGTARARFGFVPWDHLMLYVTGGGAFGDVAATATGNTTTSLTVGGTPVGAPTSKLASANFTDRRAGWTVGGGAEWVLSGPWTAKVEYLFVDLGSYSNTVPGNPAVPSTLISSHVTDNIVRLGINYRFGGSVVAGY
jgi:outer membrane immunogenic protein